MVVPAKAGTPLGRRPSSLRMRGANLFWSYPRQQTYGTLHVRERKFRLIEAMNPSGKTVRTRLTDFLNWVPAIAGTTSSYLP
jgi:hypothetical protein